MTDDLMKQIQQQRERREQAEDLQRYVLEEFGQPWPSWCWIVVFLYWVIFSVIVWLRWP